LPTQPDRRLAVIRIRSTTKIHFLTAKNAPAPVYVRNEDEAIPARASELRNLIERERSAENLVAQYVDTSRLLNLLPITRAQQGWSRKEQPEPPQRIAAPSVLRLWIIPDQSCRVPLDYHTELAFRDLVFKTFPRDSFVEDSSWNSSEEIIRDRNFARIDYAHVERDLQSKWVLTEAGEFGYATVLAEEYPGGPLWSLSDLTIELIAAVKTAHALFVQVGYLGDASVHLFANPGQGQLHQERGMLPFLRHTSNNRQPPAIQSREIIPKSPNSLVQRDVSCFGSSNFQTRAERLDTLAADLLNQFLRDLGYGAVLTKLREYVALIA
jgi:hypothetical protein